MKSQLNKPLFFNIIQISDQKTIELSTKQVKVNGTVK